jgi:hypothetical protein
VEGAACEGKRHIRGCQGCIRGTSFDRRKLDAVGLISWFVEGRAVAGVGRTGGACSPLPFGIPTTKESA